MENLNGKKKSEWTWHVPSREEKFRYDEQLKIFAKKVRIFENCKTWSQAEMQYESIQREKRILKAPPTKSSASYWPAFYHSLTWPSLPLNIQNSMKALSIDGPKDDLENSKVDGSNNVRGNYQPQIFANARSLQGDWNAFCSGRFKCKFCKKALFNRGSLYLHEKDCGEKFYYGSLMKN